MLLLSPSKDFLGALSATYLYSRALIPHVEYLVIETLIVYLLEKLLQRASSTIHCNIKWTSTVGSVLE